MANPTAGRRRQTLGSRVIADLEARGATVEQAPPGVPDASPALRAAVDRHDAVIACGGDGTLRAIAAALGPASIPIGLVPAGTGNVMAHELGLPYEPRALADLLLGGPVARLEGAAANGVPFFLMAGVGFDATVMRALNTSFKRRAGKVAFAAPLLSTLAAPAPRLELDIDGARYRAASAVITRARHYGGGFLLLSRAGLHRPGLHVVLLLSEGRGTRLRQLVALARGRLEHDADVKVLPADRVTVGSETPVPVQLDGDPTGTTPLEVRSGGPSLDLIVPPAFLQRRAP